MDILDKWSFKYWDPVAIIKKLVAGWRPRNCTTEKDYENSLCRFLRRQFGEDILVEKQFAQGRFKADLKIGNDLIIEIKKDLITTSQYHRLIGQLTEYREWEGMKIVILVVGKKDPSFVSQLKAFTGDDTANIFQKLYVVEK